MFSVLSVYPCPPTTPGHPSPASLPHGDPQSRPIPVQTWALPEILASGRLALYWKAFFFDSKDWKPLRCRVTLLLCFLKTLPWGYLHTLFRNLELWLVIINIATLKHLILPLYSMQENQVIVSIFHSDGPRIFLTRGAPIYNLANFLPKTAWKWENLGRERGGVRPCTPYISHYFTQIPTFFDSGNIWKAHAEKIIVPNSFRYFHL